MESDSLNPNGYDANQDSTWVAATSEQVVKTQTANASKPLGMDTVATRAWLVKIPKFVKEQWDVVGATPGTVLGRMRVHRAAPGAKGPPKITLHLPQNPLPQIDFWTDNLPKDYSVILTNQATSNTYVMTTNEAQDSAEAFTATVAHEATVNPVINPEYRALSKKRQEAELLKKRNVMRMDESETKKRMRVGNANVASVEGSIIKASATQMNVMTGKTNQADKRERMDRSDLVGILVKLFHEHQYYTLKDLMDRTAQPQAWLKEVLGDVAILIRKGLNNGMYELKPEFQADEKAEPEL